MFDLGLRPFFALAALCAALGIAFWIWLLRSGAPDALAPRDWHAHEMIFGYGSAVLAGFLLTAIPNWTSRRPIAGAQLKVLCAVWLIGRLVLLLCGRVMPAFSRNWMQAHDISQLPAAHGIINRAAIFTGVTALAAFVLLPSDKVTGWLLALTCACHGLRLARWRGWLTWREPLVSVLHLGYAWMVAGFGLLALSVLGAGVSASAALHALTAGAVGTMTLAMMTRATRGHSARPLQADVATRILYTLVLSGAALCVCAPWFPWPYLTTITAAAVLWSGAFFVFMFGYGAMLLGRRATTAHQ